MSKIMTLENYAAAAKKIAAGIDSIPTKISDLENDSGYLTADTALEAEIDAITSDEIDEMFSLLIL